MTMSCAHPSSRGGTRFCLGDESPVRPVSPSHLKITTKAGADESLMVQKALGAAPVMTITPYAAYKRSKKPLKSILKRPEALQGSGSTPSIPKPARQRRCVSFTGFSNSRWDSDNTASASSDNVKGGGKAKHPSRKSIPHVNVTVSSSSAKDSCICHLTGNGHNHHHHHGHSHSNGQRNFNWANPPPCHNGRGRSKSSSSPRLPRRDASSVSPTRTKASSLKPPRRRLSHENLFQHKIDFFLEQTAEHGKRLEDQQEANGAEDDPAAPSQKHKDIEDLEMSLMSMQKFLVALHSVPNNQKLLQKHMEHQTHIQNELKLQKEQQHIASYSDDEDDEDFSSDDEDDDEHLDALYHEMIRHRPLPSLSLAVLGEDIYSLKEEE